MLVLGGNNSADLAKSVARKCKAKFARITTRTFPDGETYIRLPNVVNRHVVIINSMHPLPNDSLIELFLAWHTAKELGARKITLIVPYMAYLRQDKRFHPGEALSNHLIAGLLSADAFITIDPHLHRIHAMKEVFKKRAKHLTSNALLAEFIKKNIPESIIMGPDGESYQWAADIAKKIRYPVVMLKKKRFSSRNVRILVKSKVPLKNKVVVIVDDIISSGHTMFEPIKQLKQLGVKRIYCVCVHGIFAENALKRLKNLGAIVISTNTISNAVAKIDVSSLIARCLCYSR
ncbi:ribose-phosphate diphosphokinase [Candidatus Woesearchaeota archaeon]|nr:ribose-phosphate diphosphokinase [Candidatus Woesearchaeota archaeon]